MITSITFDDISPYYVSTSKLKWLIGILNALDIRCTLFVVPDPNLNSSLKQEFASCLITASHLGHELSLHGHKHTKNEFGYFYPIPLPFIPLPTFRKQKERIEQAIADIVRLTGVRPLGFRAPFYLYNNVTVRVLSALNFTYDSSKTVYKPTHKAHLRIRWSGNCKPHRVQGLTEIPVTGDYTYNLRRANLPDSLKRAIHDFNWAKSHDGVFVMNIHLGRLGKSLLCEFLELLVDKLRGKTDFARLIDVSLESNAVSSE